MADLNVPLNTALGPDGEKIAVIGEVDSNGKVIVPVTLNGSLVVDRIERSTSTTITYQNDKNGLEICNDGASSLTFALDSLPGRTFTMLAGDIFKDPVPPFKVVTIVSDVAYRFTAYGSVPEVGVIS